MSFLLISISIICCIGIPLNGIVIWLLGFQIKRNPFTVLILNLAIADFGYLLFWAIFRIFSFIPFGTQIPYLIVRCLIHIMHINGFFLLAAISIDRCVCVMFPIWHRCSRPKHLSPAVCSFFWICSVLIAGIQKIMEFQYFVWWDFYLVVTAVLCLPLITISTLILFVKTCLKPKQIKRGRLLVMILITLVCFLILTLPLYFYVLYAYYLYMKRISSHILFDLHEFITLTGCLNSSVNPVIYYLVGRKKQAQLKESIKVIFQRVLREDEAPESTEKATNRVSTPL